MKKILTFCLFMSMNCSLNAFNLYNATSLDDLQDGAVLNKALRLGLADTEQATLISPRLAVTARHQGQGDIAVNNSISFYGQRCKIIRTIDRPDLKIGLGDVTLYVLDRDIILPDGEAFCPIATQTRSMGAGFGDGSGFIAHAISHSPGLKLAGQKDPSRNKSILYGRTLVDKAPLASSPHDTAFADTIRVVMSAGKDCDLMTPIKGDSGSPLYIPLKNGEYALWGALSCVDATNEHKFGCYTSLACNISWLQRKEQDLINRGILPASTMRIKTASQQDWDLTKKESLALPRKFDTELYLALNPDVALAFQGTRHVDVEAKNHFLRNALREKRVYDLPPTFKTKNYAAFNKDLDDCTANLSPDKKEKFLKLHYIRCGKEENRLYAFPETFCWTTYLALNQDLARQLSSSSTTQIKDFVEKHYARQGRIDGRPFTLPAPFNWSAYLGMNTDFDSHVDGLSLKEAKHFAQKHFALSGYNEGRLYALPGDFKTKTYLSLNLDLKKAVQRMTPAAQEHFLVFHYLRSGQKEGRLYCLPATFNIRCYFAFNPDLRRATRHLSPSARGHFLLQHFIQGGYKENRLFAVPDDFDPITYLILNPDIAKIASRQPNILCFAKEHYIHTGILERRSYQDEKVNGFQLETYLSLNPDVADAAKKTPDPYAFAFEHAITRGLQERRLFKVPLPHDFDPISYLTLNPDVAQKACLRRDPLAVAKEHYLHTGIWEKRLYQDNRFTDFRPEIYLALNPDVATVAQTKPDPFAFAFEHAITCSLNEKRLFKNPLPIDFSVKRYLEMHFDISLHLDNHPELDPESFARQHYQTNGSVLEKRAYK